MNPRAQNTTASATSAELCQLWSPRVDALDRHLSVNRWVLTAVTVVLITYPITRIVVPALLHGMVPDVVRNVLNLM